MFNSVRLLRRQVHVYLIVYYSSTARFWNKETKEKIYPDMDVTSCRNTTGQHVDLIIYIKHFHIDYIIILQQIYIFKFIGLLFFAGKGMETININMTQLNIGLIFGV
jgi:hypothetical protein